METSVDSIEIRSFKNERHMTLQQWILTLRYFLNVRAFGDGLRCHGLHRAAHYRRMGTFAHRVRVVMGAAPIGFAIGAIFAGSSSDHFGRRQVLIASFFSFGVLTLLTAFMREATEMPALRFLTGFNIGSALIGFVAAWLIPIHSWRSAARSFRWRSRPPPARVGPQCATSPIAGPATRSRGSPASICIPRKRFSLTEERAPAAQLVAVLFSRLFQVTQNGPMRTSEKKTRLSPFDKAE